MENGIMTIKILVNGAQGKMGKAVVDAVKNDSECTLIGTGDKSDKLEQLLQTHKPDVVVDFTVPASAYENTKKIIEAGAHPVIGTTGMTLEQIKELQQLCAQKKLGGVIAPNFCIGTVLMMLCAEKISRYMPDASIIEIHNPHKLDAPSGTSKKTAEMMAKQKPSSSTCTATLADNSALGFRHHGIPIHSLRLPGVVAIQEVIFGGQAETLTIRHDTLDRTAFMPGVLLACKKVMHMKELAYGLEHLLENQ
jgi:4-hydroxy-tetrahydrodipicolinate reductase